MVEPQFLQVAPFFQLVRKMTGLTLQGLLLKKRMHHTRIELTSILPVNTFKNLNEFLKQRAQSVRDTINTRHTKKYCNLKDEYNKETNATKNTSVINLSKKPLTDAERSLLEKGPKFAITPAKIPHKNIIAEVETAIKDLPDETKDIIRTNTASILDRARIPPHAPQHKYQ